jgi:single-stranded-DNA-specific exonuclease
LELRKEKLWIQPKKIPQQIEAELAEFSRVERQILFMRGIASKSDAVHFLGKNKQDDHDPFMMTGMELAVERIEAALKKKEKIVVYGDYDADGVTSTVLIEEVIGNMGGQVDHYIPDRFTEGYGLNDAAISKIVNRGAKLIICVDCGVRDVDLIGTAAKAGVDVIVIDHHEPGRELPPAVAIINPRQEDDAYPFKSLAGVGLAYKVAQALISRLGAGSLEDLLDLVALGTVADVVRLRGENRNLAARGIDRLNSTSRPGIIELMKIARLRPGSISSTKIGFIIGPRLNAAGRLGSAERAVRLLATTDEVEAEQLAAELDRVNRRRQKLTEKSVNDAILAIEASGETPDAIVVTQKDFNEGVVGLIASRLKEMYYRPTFAATRGEEITRGSARSIPGFNVAIALEACRDLLIKYGGHEKAGGFTLETRNLPEFEERLIGIAGNQLDEDGFLPKLEIDAEVHFKSLGEDLMEFFNLLEPFGEGNRAPVLMTKQVAVAAKRAVGAEGKHLKLTMRKEGRTMDAIAFRLGHLASRLPEIVDVAYRLERNEYMGIESLQMNVDDIRW